MHTLHKSLSVACGCMIYLTANPNPNLAERRMEAKKMFANFPGQNENI